MISRILQSLVWSTALLLGVFFLAPPSWGGPRWVIKYGHITPLYHGQSAGVEHFKRCLEERTNHDIEVQVFPAGQVGGERAMLKQVQSGTLKMAAISTHILSEGVPQLLVVNLPFLFPDRRTAYTVLDSDVRDRLFAPLPSIGLKALAWTENDFRDLTNDVRPVRKPEDFKGLRIAHMNHPLYRETFELLGAEPVTLPFAELYGALQKGIVDGQDNPFYTSILMRFTEVNKHLTLTHHSLDEGIQVVNHDFWKRLPENYRGILLEAAYEAQWVNRAHMAKEKLALSMFASVNPETGAPRPGPSIYKEARRLKVQIVELTDAERRIFGKAMQPLYEKYRSIVGPEIFDALTAKIQEVNRYRR